ncbi:MAG: hypothetical protein ACTJLM_02070 [Ehrlichia sp.]
MMKNEDYYVIKKENITDGKGGCLSSVCIYSSNKRGLAFPTPITMFGSKQCDAIPNNLEPHFRYNLSNRGNLMKISLSDYYVGYQQYCYDNGLNVRNSRRGGRTGSNVHSRSSYVETKNGDVRLNHKVCYNADEIVTLSCYRSQYASLKINVSSDEYVCCYLGVGKKDYIENLCWKTKGSVLLREFSNYDLPSELPIEFRQDFYDGSMALLSDLSDYSAQVLRSEKIYDKKKIQYEYVYDPKEKTFCLNTTDRDVKK